MPHPVKRFIVAICALGMAAGLAAAAAPPNALLKEAAQAVGRKDYREASELYGRYLETHPEDARVVAYRELLMARLPPRPRGNFYVGLEMASLITLNADDIQGWIPDQAKHSGSVSSVAPMLVLGWHAASGWGVSGFASYGASKHFEWSYTNLGGSGDLGLGLWCLGPSFRHDIGKTFSVGADLGVGQAVFMLNSVFTKDGETDGTLNGQGQSWAENVGLWGEWQPWKWLCLRLAGAWQQADLTDFETVLVRESGNQTQNGAGSLASKDGGALKLSQSGLRLELGLLARF